MTASTPGLNNSSAGAPPPPPFRRQRRVAAVFGIVLALGLALGLQSSSASVNEVIDWETGNTSQTTGLECPTASNFSIVTSPVRQGTYAAHFHLDSNSGLWSNGWPRCLATNYNSGETAGQEYYYGFSVLIPQSGIGSSVWELHDPASIYSVSGCTLAPFMLHAENYNGLNGLYFRIATGNCTPGQSGWPEQELNIPLPSLDPYPVNTWMDFVVHIKFTEDNSGVVEVWDRTGSNPYKLEIARSGIPTTMYCDACGVHNIQLYTEMGLYNTPLPPGSSYDEYIDGYMRGSSFNDVAPGAAPAPTTTITTTTTTSSASVSSTSSITDGATLSGTTNWRVQTSSPVASVQFFHDNISLGTVQTAGTSFSYPFDTTALSNGAHTVGYALFDGTGTMVGRSSSLNVTIANTSTATATTGTTTTATTTPVATTVATTTARTATTTTTATATTTSSGNNGNGGNGGSNGKKGGPPGRAPAADDSALVLATTRVVRAASVLPGRDVSTVSATVAIQGTASLRVSAVSTLGRHKRIPLLAQSRIGALGITYWRKTIVTPFFASGSVQLHLRIPTQSLKHGQWYAIRIRSLSTDHVIRTTYVRFHR